MTGDVLTAAVVGYEERVFLMWEAENVQGLRQVYAVTESVRDAERLGHDLKQAISAPWPDISPEPGDLIKGLATAVGISSYTRFVTRSAYVSADRIGLRFHLAALKPDGRAGYSAVQGDPEYDLIDPSDTELGDSVLVALQDSWDFPDRPRIR